MYKKHIALIYSILDLNATENKLLDGILSYWQHNKLGYGSIRYEYRSLFEWSGLKIDTHTRLALKSLLAKLSSVRQWKARESSNDAERRNERAYGSFTLIALESIVFKRGSVVFAFDAAAKSLLEPGDCYIRLDIKKLNRFRKKPARMLYQFILYYYKTKSLSLDSIYELIGIPKSHRDKSVIMRINGLLKTIKSVTGLVVHKQSIRKPPKNRLSGFRFKRIRHMQSNRKRLPPNKILSLSDTSARQSTLDRASKCLKGIKIQSILHVFLGSQNQRWSDYHINACLDLFEQNYLSGRLPVKQSPLAVLRHLIEHHAPPPPPQTVAPFKERSSPKAPTVKQSYKPISKWDRLKTKVFNLEEAKALYKGICGHPVNTNADLRKIFIADKGGFSLIDLEKIKQYQRA